MWEKLARAYGRQLSKSGLEWHLFYIAKETQIWVNLWLLNYNFTSGSYLTEQLRSNSVSFERWVQMRKQQIAFGWKTYLTLNCQGIEPQNACAKLHWFKCHCLYPLLFQHCQIYILVFQVDFIRRILKALGRTLFQLTLFQANSLLGHLSLRPTQCQANLVPNLLGAIKNSSNFGDLVLSCRKFAVCFKINSCYLFTVLWGLLINFMLVFSHIFLASTIMTHM